MNLESAMREAVEAVCADPENYVSENRFQEALAAQLGGAPRELLMTFDPPPISPQLPSVEDIAYCAERNRKLSPAGKDPCDGRSRKLDILWNDIPIELKSVVEVKADVYGYYFLKDVHRLERLSGVATGESLSITRYSIFVSGASTCWEPINSTAPQVYDKKVLESGHWVQYEQPSALTRWLDYPPFYLAGRYQLNWTPLPNGAKYLLVKVQKQASESS
jgi:hypothetical protein